MKEQITHRKQGKLPVNARVNIDYSGDKPKAKFSYPKKDSYKQVRNSQIVQLVMLICIIILGITGMLLFYEPSSELKKNCSVTMGEFNTSLNRYFDNLTLTCDNFQKTYIFPFGETKFNNGNLILKSTLSQTIKQLIPMVIYIFLSAIFVLIIIPKITAKIIMRSPYLLRRFPKINSDISDSLGKKYSCVFKKTTNLTCEIPLFHNVKLQYKATKDFSKQLISLDIIEHPFNKIVRKGKHRKKEKNIHYWRAIFRFKEEPKDGKLECWFN
jgi:hypothetical protein